MGQYFKYVNLDRSESITPPGGMKAFERVAGSTGMLEYLLLEGPQDGTVLHSQPSDEERERIIEERYSDRDYDDHDLTRLVGSHCNISDVNEFAGRWAGDRITLVGDYAESGEYDEEHDNITERVIEEMNDVMNIDV